MTNSIIEFLTERKRAREKKPGTKSQQQIDNEFNLQNWVTLAAERARQLTIVTHPGKYGHPDASVTAISSDQPSLPDGYLRSGNVPDIPRDVFGNAAALDVYAFLSLALSNGRSVLENLRDSSPEIRSILSVEEKTFEKIRSGFLAIEEDSGPLRTDGKIKQVYFPLSADGDETDYHLLSVLTPSGMVFEQRQRIHNAKFSDEAKAAREARRNGQHSEIGFHDFPCLLTMHFGGSQPQNVSRLNSSNSGEALLLACLPPVLASDYVRLPKRDFFAELYPDDELKELMTSVHRLFVVEYNNVNIREAREYWLTRIYDWVFERAMRFQSLPAGWSQQTERVQIPVAQKQWLDPESFPNPLTDEVRNEIIASIVRWITATYRKLMRDSIVLGAVEESHFRAELDEYARQKIGGVL